MRDQAQRLSQAVSVFNVGANALAPQTAAAPASLSVTAAAPVVRQARLQAKTPPAAAPAPRSGATAGGNSVRPASALPLAARTEGRKDARAGQGGSNDDGSWESF
jgi:hypothetical protein